MPHGARSRSRTTTATSTGCSTTAGGSTWRPSARPTRPRASAPRSCGRTTTSETGGPTTTMQVMFEGDRRHELRLAAMDRLRERGATVSRVSERTRTRMGTGEVTLRQSGFTALIENELADLLVG